MRVQNIHRVGIYLRLSRDDGNSNAESMSMYSRRTLTKDTSITIQSAVW